MQDIGGRNTATVYGWANMWGNLGASLSAFMVPQLLKLGESSGNGQLIVFTVCSGFFFVACAASFWIDASEPITLPRAAFGKNRSDGTSPTLNSSD